MAHLSKVVGSWKFAAALMALAANPAYAADLSEPFEVIDYGPVGGWTGFYAGGTLGMGWSDDNADTTGTTAFQALGSTIVPSSLGLSHSGLAIGLTTGYNHQSGHFVYGLEGDFSFLDLDETATFTGLPVLGTRLATSASHSMNFFGTVRGRLGYAPSDRLLIFATGGLAFGQVDLDASVRGVDAPALNWNGSNEEFKFGWSLGAGGEYKFTDRWSFKLDGLYYDLDDSSVTARGNAAVRAIGALDGIDYRTSVDNTGFLARAGVNYRF